jgi:hypothetical protein
MLTFGRLHVPRVGRVLAQGAMRAGLVVVGEVRRQDAPQVPLA